MSTGPSQDLRSVAVDDGAQKVNFASKNACPAGGNDPQEMCTAGWNGRIER